MSEIKQATQIVHWPGKDTAACDEHAAKLRRLASVMGFAISATVYLDEPKDCDNCRHEAQKA